MFRIDEAIDAIRAAPFDGWEDALKHFVTAGAGWGGQFLRIAHSGELLLHKSYQMSADLLQEFEKRGGADPRMNPRARILSQSPMRIMVDDDFLSPEEQRRHPFYDFLHEVDGPHVSFVRFQLPDRSNIIAASIRGKRAGQIDSAQRCQLEALLPQLAISLRLQQRLDGQNVLIARGTMEALHIAAFFLDPTGLVMGLTAKAEALVRQQTHISLRAGRVEAFDRPGNRRLQAAIAQACRPELSTHRETAGQPVVLRGEGKPIIAEIASLPVHSASLRLGATAILAFPDFRSERNDRTELLREAFGFTTAEAEVGLALTKGHSPAEIAQQRDVTIFTVRDQIKAIFMKTGVQSQIALMSLLSGLLG